MPDNALKESIQTRNIRLSLKATTKDEAIRELVGVIHASTPLRSVEDVVRAILTREQMMSTSLGNGVAIPHGKTDTVDRLHVALAILPEGLDFGDADGHPVRILVLLVSPPSRAGLHLRFMAEFARAVQSEPLRAALLAATTPERVRALFAGEDR